MVSTVTGYSDMAPSPRVVIDIDDADLDPATVTATVIQSSKWGEVDVNLTPSTVAGGLVLTDYGVPFGVTVLYRVRQFDAAGAELGVALSLSTVVEIDPAYVVISDPLAPSDAVMVTAEIDFTGTLSRGRASTIYQAGGRSFAMSGLMSGFQKVPLRCFTTTESEREALSLILEQPLILVRTMPALRLPGAFYATLDELPMSPWDAQDGGEVDVWDIVGNQVSRPNVEIIVAVYSYDLYKAYLDEKYPPFGTYDDAAAEWSTYIAAIRNPPPLV